MNIDYPLQTQSEDLRSLWHEAFGDDDAFLDIFYNHGFNPDRCRCITQDGKVVAALYWFDCSLNGQPLAYLYGIATAKAYRGKGLCRALLENAHSHLKYLGYAGIVLVPGDEKLSKLYEKLGYTPCTTISEFSCAAAQEPVALRKVDSAEYCQLRRSLMPANGVIQEGDALPFLEHLADFYAGEDFLVTVTRQDPFFATELLGNTQAAPGILAALHWNKGTFRYPGNHRSFAMYHPLSDAPAPEYFGIAFD
ncbi:MAG: GNAT family N-acetyltransferase [Ruminococcaceae bacterium]|nr:GNAT family N-acetyltransferase [Oscillospiraceae bacterium]